MAMELANIRTETLEKRVTLAGLALSVLWILHIAFTAFSIMNGNSQYIYVASVVLLISIAGIIGIKKAKDEIARRGEIS